jgi:cytochrome c peroxidase
MRPLNANPSHPLRTRTEHLACICAIASALGLLALGCRPFGGKQRRPAPAPPPEAPAVLPAAHSLEPRFRLLPRAEYARIAPPLAGAAAPASDADFEAAGVAVSAADKLDEIAAQLAQERGAGANIDLLPLAEDRERARRMPFRGNPSDVAIVRLAGETRVFVPLGGDLTTPGNEVAALRLAAGGAELLARIRVGIRPQRLAADPAGLVYVCNAYSNYLSVIDAASASLLGGGASPARIATDYHCSDLEVAASPAAPGVPERRDLFIANRWRRSVLRYRIELARDAAGQLTGVRQTPADGSPDAELRDVGASPTRLALDTARNALYALSWRGGDVARIDLAGFRVAARFDAGAPAIDLAVLGARALLATLMPDRGLLAAGSALPPDAAAAPVELAGLDGQRHVAHPGALTDATRSYNFEDIRNGLFELAAELGDPAPRYFTDDVAAEPSYAAAQKLLAGALPQALIRNAAGDRVYVAFGGSSLVQELAVAAESSGFALTPLRSFATRERPFALALDEAAGQLLVVSWGGEALELFDLASGTRSAEIDLGYASPRYPASAIERGEHRFYDASWSNNGRKSCAHCHFDELVDDGLPYSNGATAPTALHRIKPNHDLLTTDAYFWNGSFANGSYRSLAFAAQTRVNCELVLFGLVEGPDSDPLARVGDPNNRFSDGRDADCRPLGSAPGALPANFDAAAPGSAPIAQVIAAQKQLANAEIQRITGLSADALAREIDLYSAAELRLPPNPDAQRQADGSLPSADRDALVEGRALFDTAGCSGCHLPNDARHPFTNGENRGRGADWAARFAERYAADPRLASALPGGLPPVFTEAIRTRFASPEINVHVDPIDFFAPFCFDRASCLAFEDPLSAGDAAEETRRLDLLLRFHLADPLRGFVPGNLRGNPAANVPSLRGVWTQTRLLHHGLARSLREAILAPGHPALLPGERGYAVDSAGRFDRHGFTSALGAEEIARLERYVRSIE